MSSAKNTPAFHAYHVQENDGKSFWTRIGAAWPTRTGKGYSVALDLLPPDGRLVLMEPKAERSEAASPTA